MFCWKEEMMENWCDQVFYPRPTKNQYLQFEEKMKEKTERYCAEQFCPPFHVSRLQPQLFFFFFFPTCASILLQLTLSL